MCVSFNFIAQNAHHLQDEETIKFKKNENMECVD